MSKQNREKKFSWGMLNAHLGRKLALLGLRSGIPQFSVPAETLQTTWSLLAPSFPSSSLQWAGEESWRHKRQRSQAEITTMYWKQQ